MFKVICGVKNGQLGMSPRIETPHSVETRKILSTRMLKMLKVSFSFNIDVETKDTFNRPLIVSTYLELIFRIAGMAFL
jgi:hypothetical protein